MGEQKPCGCVTKPLPRCAQGGEKEGHQACFRLHALSRRIPLPDMIEAAATKVVLQPSAQGKTLSLFSNYTPPGWPFCWSSVAAEQALVRASLMTALA